MYKMSDTRVISRTSRGFLALILAVLAGITPSARAVELRASRIVTIPAEQVLTANVYAAGEEVLVFGTVQGDLVGASHRLLIEGTVTEDVTVAGGHVEVRGQVGDDLRIAGGTVDLSGTVTGDVVVAGATLRILSGTHIGGDVILAGRSVLIDGTLDRSARAVGDQVTVGATVRGPVALRATRVTISDTAVLESAVAYFSPEVAAIGPQARITGPVTYHIISGLDQQWIGHVLGQIGFAFFLFGFVMTLGAGLIIAFLFRRPAANLVTHAMEHFGTEMLRGFVFFFVIPPAIFLLTLTVVGVPLAFLAGLLHLSVGMISVIFAGILLGSLLLRLSMKSDRHAASWRAVLLGIPLAFLVSLVPIAGFFFNTAFFLAIFGTLYESFWAALRRAV